MRKLIRKVVVASAITTGFIALPASAIAATVVFASASATSTSGNYVASNTIDKSTSTRWVAAVANASITVNFTSCQKVDDFTINWTGSTKYAFKAELFNGSSWVTVANTSGSGDTHNINVTDQAAKAIRITGNNSVLSIDEITANAVSLGSSTCSGTVTPSPTSSATPTIPPTITPTPTRTPSPTPTSVCYWAPQSGTNNPPDVWTCNPPTPIPSITVTPTISPTPTVSPTSAPAASLGLASYTRLTSYNLSSSNAPEASAVTWNWDTDTLFTIGDGGKYIAQFSKTGTYINKMTLSGFEDNEGLAYIGNGQFVVADERIQDLFQLTYAAGTTATRSKLPSVSLGDTVGNIGIEGVSFDRLTGQYVAVKEKTPAAIYEANIDFSAKTISKREPYAASTLGLTDISDVQALSLIGVLDSNGQKNRLILSQESKKLLEVTPAGVIVGTLDIAAYSITDAEGVTIDGKGTIYIMEQTPKLHIFTKK